LSGNMLVEQVQPDENGRFHKMECHAHCCYCEPGFMKEESSEG
jgi:hypothetical protein